MASGFPLDPPRAPQVLRWVSRRRAEAADVYTADANNGCVNRIPSPSSETSPESIAGFSVPSVPGPSPDAAARSAKVGRAAAAVVRSIWRVGSGSADIRSTRRARRSSGTRKGLPHIRRTAPGELPCDLESEERVPVGNIVNPFPYGTGKIRVHSVSDQTSDVIRRHRPNQHALARALMHRPGRSQWIFLFPSGSHGCEHPDRLVLQSPHDEAKDGRGGWVEPLNVVDRKQNRTVSCQRAKASQRAKCNRALIGDLNHPQDPREAMRFAAPNVAHRGSRRGHHRSQDRKGRRAPRTSWLSQRRPFGPGAQANLERMRCQRRLPTGWFSRCPLHRPARARLSVAALRPGTGR